MNCEKEDFIRKMMPSYMHKYVHFKNFKYQMQMPFIVYADIESLLVSITQNGDDEDEIWPTITTTSTRGLPKGAVKRHVPNSVGYYFLSSIESVKSYYRVFQGPDCIGQFIHDLYELMRDTVWPKLLYVKPMEMTESEEKNFQNQLRCHICNGVFDFKMKDCTDENGKACKKMTVDDKVRDHCHLTGKYRGAAHPNCNLNYQISRTLPIVFHNLDYDSHFLIEELANNDYVKGPMSIIPKNSEHYISFTKILTDIECDVIELELPVKNEKDNSNKVKTRYERARLRFIDSYKFLACGLQKLASLLDFEELKVSREEWTKDWKENSLPYSDEHVRLLKRKGVYPYEFMSSWDKMECTELPSKYNFYDSMNERDITQDEYEHAQNVWQTFNVQSMAEYTRLYLKTDVLLLADIFENFRRRFHALFQLDPAHYYTLPGYTNDAMLKYTNASVELFTDVDDLIMVERGLRGGISQCNHRNSVANNKEMGNLLYDPTKPIVYDLYLDKNNLYGWAMSQPLPYAEYKNVTDMDFSNIDEMCRFIEKCDPINDKIGYFLEVDLEYPVNLHDKHNDLPYCPEHLCVADLVKNFKYKIDHMEIRDSKEKKLILTLHDKKNYVIHYRMLKLALRHGLKLTKVHRMISFKQARWVKPYIDINTQHRTQATNKFDKDLFKLNVNASYGKHIENIMKRCDIRLITKWNGRYGLGSLIARPNFKRNVIFNENLVACEMHKSKVWMIKPTIVGIAILEISKCLMYEFHYDFMLKHFNKENVQCKILYTDTDSFLYELSGDNDDKVNPHKFIANNSNEFDTSDYAKDNKYGIGSWNKKVLGKMKDEMNGQIIQEFIGLRSKMYCIRTLNNDDDDDDSEKKLIKKAKGVKKCVLDKKITFMHYKQCLESLSKDSVIVKEQSCIRSFKHDVFQITNDKKVLDPFDDKRYLIPNSYATLAWGHKNIR